MDILDEFVEIIRNNYKTVSSKYIKGALEHYMKEYGNMLRNGVSGPSIAVSFHDLVDKVIEEHKKVDSVYKEVVCKRKCSHCCKTAVSVTHEEAELLLAYTKEMEIPVNKDKLKVQSSIDYHEWIDLGAENRSCIFLKDNECQVYEYRPLTCRTHFVISNRDYCDTARYKKKRVGMWKPLNLEIMGLAVTVMGRTDSMPKKLLKLME